MKIIIKKSQFLFLIGKIVTVKTLVKNSLYQITDSEFMNILINNGEFDYV